ncbi:HAD-IA family hydrolase [Roseomonas genomospecies 6]|uniref:HAD family hydrolase n=1 Tax=Roseomonas genomospecies 6 TaxID=214106 RepID=A0A9W7TZG7_9PROT|nr:HAD-IA family hydrolase [Roseomonas genomospecies 6]KAA0681098.1 HAD family hydrolase [Roseomonas genomospecies 6]
MPVSSSVNARPLRLALFDCDGTLVDSQFAIIDAMTTAWTTHGLGEPDPLEVRRMVGLPLMQAVALLLPDQDTDRHVAVTESYKDAFAALRRRGDLHEPLFPGILDTLDALEATGVLLGVATGKSRRGLDAVLAHHRLTHRFVTLQTSDIGPGKPHPDMVYRALAEAGVEAAGTVVIGDTTYDIQMARNARVASVGVSWGYHAVAELEGAGADRIVHRGREVAGAVLALLDR